VTVGVIKKAGTENSKAVYYTKEKFVHKNYDDVYLTSDIALLKLPSSVDISGEIFFHFYVVKKLNFLHFEF
jgi:Trypsin